MWLRGRNVEAASQATRKVAVELGLGRLPETPKVSRRRASVVLALHLELRGRQPSPPDWAIVGHRACALVRIAERAEYLLPERIVVVSSVPAPRDDVIDVHDNVRALLAAFRIRSEEHTS